VRRKAKKLSPCVPYILFAFFWCRHGPVSGEGKKEENRTGGRLDTEPYVWSLKPFTLLPVHSSPKLFAIDHTFVITSLKGIFQRLYAQMSLLGMFATKDVPTKGLEIRVKPLRRNIPPGTHVAYLVDADDEPTNEDEEAERDDKWHHGVYTKSASGLDQVYRVQGGRIVCTRYVLCYVHVCIY
jgi:hypothetical protein